MDGPLADRLPDAPGEALMFDDATESAHAVSVRERRTAHGGASPHAGGETAGDARRAAGGRAEERP